MKTTPLYPEHQKLNARFTEFAGFYMPVSYGAVKGEVLAVRQRCGMFDVSHMLPMALRAATPQDLVQSLNRVTVRPTDKLKPGKAQYNALYNENAGLVDDVTLAAISETHWHLVANAANREAVTAHLKKHCTGIATTPWQDYVLLAVQGPDSEKFVSAHFAAAKDLYYYEVVALSDNLVIGRMGYTGEDGFEIACPRETGIALWKELYAAGVLPCGLAARDVLRLEALLPLYGNELSATLRPQESGIAFIYSDHDCIAPRALREKAVEKITCGFLLEAEGVPRKGYPVCDGSGTVVGEVTSGTFSFTLNRGIGFMRIAADARTRPLFVAIRDEKKPIALLDKTPIKGSIKRRPKI
ncbi:MAG: glycine cleavage system aminomethyltransferase GcvT [Turneriella sp.]|nr:glycine cleavage system aminomethyltransferase GcvT [Turneriella sp.]